MNKIQHIQYLINNRAQFVANQSKWSMLQCAAGFITMSVNRNRFRRRQWTYRKHGGPPLTRIGNDRSLGVVCYLCCLIWLSEGRQRAVAPLAVRSKANRAQKTPPRTKGSERDDVNIIPVRGTTNEYLNDI